MNNWIDIAFKENVLDSILPITSEILRRQIERRGPLPETVDQEWSLRVFIQYFCWWDYTSVMRSLKGFYPQPLVFYTFGLFNERREGFA